MSITSAKIGASGISLALDNNYMEPIATTLIGSGGALSVLFNDIPQNYKHLQIRFIARTSSSGNGQDDLSLIFNSDFSTNYSWNRYGSSGVGIVSGGSGSASGYQLQEYIARNGQGSNVFSTGIIDIIDYKSTYKYKIVKAFGGDDNASTTNGAIMLDTMSWQSMNPITSIYLSATGSSFLQNSRFSLYGIK
jgi:hypothetical protein